MLMFVWKTIKLYRLENLRNQMMKHIYNEWQLHTNKEACISG